MSHQTRINIAVVFLVGLGMPGYYKIKYILLDMLKPEDVFNWGILIDLGAAFGLAIAVMLAYQSIQKLISRFFPGQSIVRRLVLGLLLNSFVAALAGFSFVQFYFTYLFPYDSPPDFLFDIIILSILIPILVGGLNESLYYHERWSDADKRNLELEKEKIRSRFELLKSQINPHFLFNSFNTLSELIEEDPSVAGQFLTRLSGVYRFILEHREKDLVTLSQELKVFDAYLFMLRIRFGDCIELNKQIDGDINTIKVVPMTLQMLLENALKHNHAQKHQKLQITLSTTAQNELAFSNSLAPKTSAYSTGFGLNSIKERYALTIGQGIQIIKSEESFTVKIPLIDKPALMEAAPA